MPEQQPQPLPSRLAWTVTFVVAATLTLALGYGHYCSERRRVSDEYADHLSVVGMLKANQIAEWRRERLADAIRFAQGPALVGPTRAFLANPDDRASRGSALSMLNLNRKGTFYQDTILVSTNLEVLLASVESQEPLSQTTRAAVGKAIASRTPVLSGIFSSGPSHEHIDTAAPICDASGLPVAVLVLRADASDSLYPLIRFWPTESASAETLLLERDGPDFVILNEVKCRAGCAQNVRRPLSDSKTGEKQAVLGASGVIRAIDYRGVDVLSDVRPIPGSAWTLVTKVDEREILAAVRRSARNIAFFVGLGILLAAALTAVGYRRRQVFLYRNLYRVERDQRAAHERFRTILYSIGDAVIVTDDHARVRQMNHVAEHLTGWQESEALGLSLDDVFRIINEETRLPVENPVWRVLREGKTVGLANHTLLLSRDGTERPIADSGAPVRDEHSTLNGVVLVFRDQSAEHDAQKALLESERRLSTLLNNLPGMAYRCEFDTSWTMRVVSEGCLSLLGYAPADLLDNRLIAYADLIHSADRDTVMDAVTQAVLARQAFTLEYRIRTKDGCEKWVWERGCAVSEPDGTIRALEGFITDITERKQASQDQARLEVQLQQAQRLEAVGRLAGGVAHDFNNMLAVIVSTAELALDRPGATPPLSNDLKDIIKASRRSADLVKQLLAFASKQPITPRILNLNSTIAAMTTMLGRLLGEDVALGWQPTPDLWNVRMDPSQIDQLLINLTVNARDAIAGVGHIQIETHNVGADALCGALPADAPVCDYVLLVLSDDGCGMSDETMAHIFEPFFSTKALGVGTGLGLSTVYGIVKQNRGFIRVSSEPGKGSRFSIFLPREGGRAELVRDCAAAPHPPPEDGAEAKTILLVEDEPALLNLTAALLRKLGYVVLAASGPLEALNVASHCPGTIHLLLTDVVMPDMSGRDLCDQLVQLRPGIRCLFMSGYTADIIAHHGVIQGDIHFLQKPFSKESLIEQLHEILSSP